MTRDRGARRIAAWLCLGLALAWVVVTGARAAGVHDARGEALRLYDAGRFAEALPLFDEVLKRKPHDLDSLNKRGCIYLRMNQPERALPDFNAATKFSPFLAYDNLALARQFAPDVQGPVGVSRYWDIQNYPSAFTNRGIAYVMLGRDDEALADFRHALDLHRVNGGVLKKSAWVGMASDYCGIGQVNYRKGQYDQAVEAYNEAIRYNPADPNGFVGRGEALAGLGRYEDALHDYAEALRLDPSLSHAYGFRAVALAQMGRAAEALADYDRAVQLEPNAAMPRRFRGALYSRLGRFDQALLDLNEAIRLDPRDAGAFKDRGGVYNQMNDPARALRDLDEAIRLDPTSGKAFQNRAASYNALGRYKEAARDGDDAVRLDPANAGARNNLGLALIGLGQYDKAVADLSEAIRLSPRLASAYLNRGGAFAQLGRHDEAAADYSVAVRLEPRLAQAYSGPDAIPEIVRVRARPAQDDLAMRQGPSAAKQSRAEGDTKRALGDWTGAVADYTRSLAADPTYAESYALRGWSRLCAGERGADADARAWFGVSSWRDPFAPYMALLGILAARHDGRNYAAGAFLEEALANARPAEWPSPLFYYLNGQTKPDDLLAAATSPEKTTVAHAVIGYDLLVRGEREAALPHLRWVRDHGTARSIAGDLAREALKSAEAASGR